MKKLATLAAAALCTLTLAAHADSATRAQTKANKEQAEADYKSAKANCKTMSGDAKKSCMAEAKAQYKSAKTTAKTDAKATMNMDRPS